MPADRMAEMERSGSLLTTFKLQTVINTSSMVLFDAAGVLRRFDTPEDILRDFVITRRHIYVKRKQYLHGLLKAQADRLSNQARFILEKIAGNIVMENKKKKYIVDRLVEMKFDPDPVHKWKEAQRKKVSIVSEFYWLLTHYAGVDGRRGCATRGGRGQQGRCQFY
jgi:DNA topoisomerase-2